MNHLDEIAIEELHQALDDVEGKKATQRLLAAIAYKNGVSQTELAEWHNVQRRTIYSWLKRLEQESLVQAVRNEHRSGRPRKLTDDQYQQLERALHYPPADVGYDAPSWSPKLVRQFLEVQFDVEYSRPSCRRLMNEAGLCYQKSCCTDCEPDSAEHDDVPEAMDDSSGRWMPQ